MKSYALSHLADSTLLHDLDSLDARDCVTAADLLAHLGEVDARRLYLPAGYPSMHAYCVGPRRYSPDTAYKRIRAARAAREFPALFAAVAEGRLTLSSVVLLAPHLSAGTVDELLAAAAHRPNTEVEGLLAERFPRPDLATQVRPVAATGYGCQLAVRPVEGQADPLVPEPVDSSAAWRIGVPASHLKPLAPERFALQVTIGKGTHDKLRHAQELLGHHVAADDLAQVLDRALDALIVQLEKRRFAATAKPRPGRHTSTRERHIPAEVRRAVCRRDQGRCTFVSETGHRCEARKGLEFDHVVEFARGGEATVDGIRLLCRAHNQYEAERTFGAEFMRTKREQARARRAESRAARAAAAEARAHAAAPSTPASAVEQPTVAQALDEQARDVLAGLRELGVRGDQARRAVAFALTLPEATLEARMRAALRYVCPKAHRVAPSPPASPDGPTVAMGMIPVRPKRPDAAPMAPGRV